MKRALLSVSDKTGIVEFAQELQKLGYEIVSTGGTFAALQKAGVSVVGITDITGFAECLDGRVKTLHPVVHAGLLAVRDNPEHMRHIKELGIAPIDVVAINLYPFKATIEKPDVQLQDAIENIDIGGPAMLRSAAKNYQDVYVICDTSDYKPVIEELKSGNQSKDTRFRLMYKVFQHTALYDTLIANYLRQKQGIELPEQITLAYEKKQDLRYGENPTQKAAFYQECLAYEGSLTQAQQLMGKELSFNNINDANGALDLLREFDEPAVIAVKHANPCGAGIAGNVLDAYLAAYNADPVSIFGGIVASNRKIDEATATEMVKTFLEIVIAPDFDPQAIAIFAEKRKNARLLKLPSISAPIKKGTMDIKKVVGGMLLQDYDSELFDEEDFKVVTKKQPTQEQIKAMIFGYKVVKHTKSNAIVVSNASSTLGIGMGQTSRIQAARLALQHAGEKAQGAVLSSDAFFPFPDCVQEAASYGITAIIQPGGSVNDQLSIDACNEAGIAMVLCGKRHFKH